MSVKAESDMVGWKEKTHDRQRVFQDQSPHRRQHREDLHEGDSDDNLVEASRFSVGSGIVSIV